MRPIILSLLGCLLVLPLYAASLPSESQLRTDLRQVEGKNLPNQADVVEALQKALMMLNDRQESIRQAEIYQQVIDDFPKVIQELRKQLSQESDTLMTVAENLPLNQLEQQILQDSSQVLELGRQLQQEQDRLREITESLNTSPHQLSEARTKLAEVQRQLQLPVAGSGPLAQAKQALLQTEVAAYKARVSELELAQLSANNRQELSRLRGELYKKRHDVVESHLQALRNLLNSRRQQEAEQVLEKTEQLAEQTEGLPSGIVGQLKINRELSAALNKQAAHMKAITAQQQETAAQILQVRQALNTIIEQSQWLSVSTALGETLRAQIARLPDMPPTQQLDSDMAQLRVNRLYFEDLREKQRQPLNITQDDGSPLTAAQQRLLDTHLRTQSHLFNSLLSGYDTQILELTKLKVANTQLIDELNEVRNAAHRYLFWVADVNPITFAFPVYVAQHLTQFLSLDTFAQLGGAFKIMFTSKETVIPIVIALLLVIFRITSRQHYYGFLQRAHNKVGKVTQDQFSLTLRTVLWSLLISLPLPILWAALGAGLQHAWPYPIAVAIGDGVMATLPVLWIFMISAAFAHRNGLFIGHFGWSPTQVARAMRYYVLTIWLIVPLMIALLAFDTLSDREFAGTLGRLCFILLCLALSLVTHSLKRAGIPLHLDKNGSGDNLVNRTLWQLLLIAPLSAAIAACIGYLATAQALLARLEISVAIWFFLLVVYYIIRRWMLIQRRRIAFERAKQRRADMLAQRARNEGESTISSSTEGAVDVEEPVVNLDAISAQSLKLVRSILTMVALVSLIILWSEIHSAFGFMENIHLWNVSMTTQGVESIQPITLGSLLVTILVFIVTAQLVRNLPALLELALLQHLDLTPGTGYAITTLTKYVLMFIGAVIGFSWMGIEWSKLQWLVAALSVGLGFGLQEIFANFISGLIILFEKPIRIGDTVTIRNLTGHVTRINTRATTITDWDRKEIIVPNKAFITEQLINWSLSDSITRIVLTVPADAEVNSDEVTRILLDAAKSCPLVLDNPAPEAYLVDIQQGIQLFELRIHAAEMAHRMPIRHELHRLILAGYHEHHLVLPFPPFQVRSDILGSRTEPKPAGGV